MHFTNKLNTAFNIRAVWKSNAVQFKTELEMQKANIVPLPYKR